MVNPELTTADDIDEIVETAEHLPAEMWEPDLVEDIMSAPFYDGEKIADEEG